MKQPNLILARATLNPVNPDVRHLLDNRERIHAAIAKATDGATRPLWRLDDDRIYVLTDRLDTDRLSARLGNAPIAIKDYAQHLARTLKTGTNLRFNIETTPCRTVKRDGQRGHVLTIRDPQQQLEWLNNKLEQGGATMTSGYITSHAPISFDKPDGHTITFGTVTYTGTLTVNDPTRLHATILNGIGREKAYGMGFLLTY